MMEIYLDEVNQSQSDEFDLHFKFIEFLASGSFGTVIRAMYLEKNKEVAVKVINKGGREKQKNINRLKQEITILKQLKHKYIVEFYGFIETNQKIYIIMEYIKNGTLKTLMERRNDKKMNEEEASKIIECLLSAVDYLHSRDICHRDIKPENIMFENAEDLTSLKLVDFGLSAQYFEVLEEYEYCGTLIYMAPEQIEKKIYTKAIDMWSTGIIMYMLLNNWVHPLYVKGDKTNQYIEKLKKPKFSFKNKASFMAKMFISKLLETNPSKRYSADKALKHPWITRRIYDSIPKTNLEIWKSRGLKQKLTEFIGALIFLLNYQKCSLKLRESPKNKAISRNNFINTATLLEEYLIKADRQSILKNDHFLKDREKCLEITITNSNFFNSPDDESNNKNEKKHNEIILSGLGNISVTSNNENNKNLSPNDVKKIQIKGNIIKNNMKIKIVKDDDLEKHIRKKSQNISNQITQDGSPNINGKNHKPKDLFTDSKIRINKYNQSGSISPDNKSVLTMSNIKELKPYSISPIRRTNYNGDDFKLNLRKTETISKSPEYLIRKSDSTKGNSNSLIPNERNTIKIINNNFINLNGKKSFYNYNDSNARSNEVAVKKKKSSSVFDYLNKDSFGSGVSNTNKIAKININVTNNKLSPTSNTSNDLNILPLILPSINSPYNKSSFHYIGNSANIVHKYKNKSTRKIKGV